MDKVNYSSEVRTVVAFWKSLLVVAAVGVGTTTPAVAEASQKPQGRPVVVSHHKPKHGTCHTKACYDRVWLKMHPTPPFSIGSVEACEANYESGEPGSRDVQFINWHMEHGGYEGGYSWLPSTWRSQRFPGYPYRAVDATPEQQTLVFRHYKNVGEWPPLANCL